MTTAPAIRIDLKRFHSSLLVSVLFNPLHSPHSIPPFLTLASLPPCLRLLSFRSLSFPRFAFILSLACFSYLCLIAVAACCLHLHTMPINLTFKTPITNRIKTTLFYGYCIGLDIPGAVKEKRELAQFVQPTN